MHYLVYYGNGAMNAQEELAKLTLGKIVTGVLLLIGLLVLIVWRETLYGVWSRAAEALSKQALMALLGLAVLIGLVVIALLAAYIIYLLRDLRQLKQPAPYKPKRMFGVHWDDEQNPLCSVCESLLHLRFKDDEGERLTCPKCKFTYILKTDADETLELVEVKKYLRGEQNEPY